MRIIGITRHQRIVASNANLDDQDLEELYYGYSKDDHYDAMCIWAAHPSLDYLDGFRNKEFHARKAGVPFTELVERASEFIAYGQKMKDNPTKWEIKTK